MVLSKWPIIFLSSNKFHQVCSSHLSLTKFIESLIFYCFQERHTVKTVSSHIIFGIQAFEVCVYLFGVLFFLVTLFIWGFLASFEFFCNQIAHSKLPKFENKIYFTYFWNSSGLESGSRFFFHLSRDLSVMSFSPGISGIPMAWANRCAPWSVSSMCFVCRKTRD